MLDRVLESCDKLQALLTDTLDLNAIEAGALTLECRAVGVAEYLRHFHDTHGILGMNKNIQVDLEIDPDCGEGWFDPGRVDQVMDNLLTNAIKYSNPGTKVTLRACPSHDGMVWIEVKDEGQGIPEEDYRFLFTEFGRCSTRPTNGESSTGLGLAICRKIVRCHGGEIDCSSVIGQGSVFRFSLPQADLAVRWRPESSGAVLDPLHEALNLSSDPNGSEQPS
jgi:signal transduction histidine kinase